MPSGRNRRAWQGILVERGKREKSILPQSSRWNKCPGSAGRLTPLGSPEELAVRSRVHVAIQTAVGKFQETHMSTLAWRTRILGSIFGLAALACLLGEARGASPSLPKSGGAGGEKVVKALHHAKHLLAEANHDYDGHRAKAARDVAEAIHELSHGHKHHTAKHHTGMMGSKGGKKSGEAQKKSDHELEEALKILNEAKTQLHHEHHKKALHHVEEAIKQLHMAVRVA
jgi:hypothetical protein